MHSPDRLDVQAGRQAGNGSMICKPNERSTAFVYDVRCTLYVWLYADVYKWITRVLNGSNQQRCYALASTSVMHPIKANRERTEFTFHRRFRAQANRIAGWASWEWNKKNWMKQTKKPKRRACIHFLLSNTYPFIYAVDPHIRVHSTGHEGRMERWMGNRIPVYHARTYTRVWQCEQNYFSAPAFVPADNTAATTTIYFHLFTRKPNASRASAHTK